MQQSQQYQLGSWIICPRTNTIKNQVDCHNLDNKSMQLLLLLIEHKGQVVSKKQIFKHVWRDKFVTDDILSVTVSKIRKALGDNARSPTFIKTLSGIGYVLIADAQEVTDVADTSPTDAVARRKPRTSMVYAGIGAILLLVVYLAFLPRADTDTSPALLGINSIAVLPFDDLSSTQENVYFTDGLSDAIINQLSQIKSLKVISRYSSFTYRGQYNATDIGQALQVDTLLDGSVQQVGDDIRINVRIFSTQNGRQLWSKTFDGDSEDIFKLQDRISTSIQAIIQPEYQATAAPVESINAQAYEWYLMGQYHWRQRNPESLEKAVRYFQHSLELEPEFADAHVGLAITYSFLHTYANWSVRRAVDTALPHINRALKLTPNSPNALAAKGLILTEKAIYMTRAGQEDPSLYQQAQHAFERALSLEDNATTYQWYSVLLAQTGNQVDAFDQLNKAIDLNPLSASLKRDFSFQLQFMGKADSAQRMYQRALVLEPDYFSRPIESSRLNRYKRQTVLDMVKWHEDNLALFATCSSDEYCEHMVFLYLSIGAHEAANNVLSNMGPTHFHFRTSLNAISASARGDDQEALRVIERFALWLSKSRYAAFDYAIAQFRAGKFEQTAVSLLQLYPAWQDEEALPFTRVTADNYPALLLYAATLAKLHGKATADVLFSKIKAFLLQDKVFDKAQGQYSLAQIYAQTGDEENAVAFLNRALEMGWMETYSKEWWSMANDHLLSPLADNLEFQQLIAQHEQTRQELRTLISLN